LKYIEKLTYSAKYLSADTVKHGVLSRNGAKLYADNYFST
jgi:hypothetical protein